MISLKESRRCPSMSLNTMLSTLYANVPAEDKAFKESYASAIGALAGINLGKIEFSNDLCKLNYISTTFALLFDLAKYIYEIQNLIDCFQHQILFKFVSVSESVFAILQPFNQNMLRLHLQVEMTKLDEHKTEGISRVLFLDSCTLIYMRYIGSKISNIFEPYIKFIQALEVKKPTGTLKIGPNEINKPEDVLGYIRSVRV